jgi:hypothetical protein
VFGVDAYLEDFHGEGNTIDSLLDNINKSDEKEIGYCIYFDFDKAKEEVFEFVKLLRKNNFYY